jgi:HEAT repeat protein
MDAEHAMPILRRVLARRDACSEKLRAHAVYLVAQKGTAGTEEVLLGIVREDPSREVREAAVFWLSGVGTQRSLDILSDILGTSREEALQEKAVYALSQHGGAQAGRLLREAAERHPSRKVREAAIYWIGHRGTEGAEYLRTLFGRLEDPALKEKVLFSLSQSGDESRRFLLSVAEDARQPVAVRKQAIYSAGLAGVPVAELSALYDRLDGRELKEQVIFALSLRGGPAVDKLIDIVRRERDGELRNSALFWLGQSRDPRAARILSEVIDQ